MNLDDEATRKMNGSDKNVACIEENIEGLKRLFYTNALTQYGKRKLIGYYEQRIKELEEENKNLKTRYDKYGRVLFTPEAIAEKHIPKSKIKEIRDKAEVMDYYTLPDVIEDLNKLLGDD